MPLKEMDNNAKLLLSEAWSTRRNREQGQGPSQGLDPSGGRDATSQREVGQGWLFSDHWTSEQGPM